MKYSCLSTTCIKQLANDQPLQNQAHKLHLVHNAKQGGKSNCSTLEQRPQIDTDPSPTLKALLPPLGDSYPINGLTGASYTPPDCIGDVYTGFGSPPWYPG